MLKKYSLTLILSLFCMNASAFNISNQILEKDYRFNSSSLSQTSIENDMKFCNTALTINCENGNCEGNKIIQNFIYKTCENAIEDKMHLIDSNIPLGNEKFTPISYHGFEVMFSRIQDLLTNNPELNYNEYYIISDIFKDIEKEYHIMDEINIHRYLSKAGEYLDKTENKDSEIYKETFFWVKNIMDERENIRRKLTLISSSLQSTQEYMDFKHLNSNLIQDLAKKETLGKFQNAIFSDSQCKAIFRLFNNQYISDLHKEIKFECDK